MKLSINKHKWQAIIMILCFIYGGVSIVIFSLQSSSLVQAEKNEARMNERLKSENNSDFVNPANFHGEPLNSNSSKDGFWMSRRPNLFYPIIIISFFGSIISILAGLSLMDLLRIKEKKELTKSVIDTMTTPDEQMVIRALEKNSGEMTQSELVKKTNLSKVKIHRVIKRLERLKIISKYPYGVTNKIKLEKEIYQE